MAKQTSLFLTQNITSSGHIFVSGEALSPKAVAIAGDNDSIVKVINIYSNNTAMLQMDFSVYSLTGNGTGDSYTFVTVPIPANAGSGIAPTVDVFSTTGITSFPYDNAGKRYLPLGSGSEIRATMRTNPISSATVSVLSIIENY